MKKSPVFWAMVAVVVLAAVFGIAKLLKSSDTDSDELEISRGAYSFLIVDTAGGARYMKDYPGFPGKAFPDPKEFKQKPGTSRPVLVTRKVLGTNGSIRIWSKLGSADEDVSRVAAGLAFDHIEEIGRELNLYNQHSDLWEVNKAAGVRAVRVSERFFTVLKRALVVAELSEGAYDPTVGPLVLLWRQALSSRVLPSQEHIQQAVQLVGYKFVKLDEEAQTVKLLKRGMILDLGGIAKGFAADDAARLLEEEGVHAATVELGGDVAAFGTKPDGSAFRIPIQNPFSPGGQPVGIVNGTDFGVVTSGNYQQYVVIGGQRFSHLVDPRTGVSVAGLASCTVTGPDAMTCDALATAICVVGARKGRALTEKMNNWYKTHGE